MLRHTSAEVSTMPIPLLLAAAFGLGNAMKKEKKKRAVSKYTFIPLLLFIGTHSVLASPVPYTMDFNLSSGSILPTSGSFTYDSSTSTFTSFDVEWDGDTFDLTSAANTSPYLPAYINQPCILSGSSTGPQEVFNLMTNCPAAYWVANDSSVSATAPSFLMDVGAEGSITSYGISVLDPAGPTPPPTTATGGFASTIVPEPSTTAFMMIGLCLVMRRRIVTGLRQGARTHR
jgi:hypothetical protein